MALLPGESIMTFLDWFINKFDYNPRNVNWPTIKLVYGERERVIRTKAPLNISTIRGFCQIPMDVGIEYRGKLLPNNFKVPLHATLHLIIPERFPTFGGMESSLPKKFSKKYRNAYRLKKMKEV